MFFSPLVIISVAIVLTVFAVFTVLVRFLREYAFRPGRAYTEDEFAALMRKLDAREQVTDRPLAANTNVQKPRPRVGRG
jgi:hypothetical protein